MLHHALSCNQHTGRSEDKNYSNKEVIKILEKDGWRFVGARGDHHYFKHPAKPGKITVPAYLNELAMEAHIDFSSTLQEALKEKLGVRPPVSPESAPSHRL